MNSTVRTSIDRTVGDITPNQKDAIQDLIGSDLAPDQRIFILAYRPGVEPSETDKVAARSRIQELLSKSHENARQQGATATEIEASIAEAVQSTDD